MLWPIILRLTVGLQAAKVYARRDWTLKPHFQGEHVKFEVSNFVTDPPVIFPFDDAFEASWFFLNVSNGEIVELP
jgi:hypothetical protein